MMQKIKRIALATLRSAVLFPLLSFSVPLSAFGAEFPTSPLHPGVLDAMSPIPAENDAGPKEFDGLPPQIQYEGVSDLLFQARVRNPGSHPDLAVAVHYPQGFGHEEADKALESWAQKTFNSARSLEFDQDITGKKGLYSFYTTYTLSRPSAKAISVVFNSWQYTGGAHNMWEDHVLSFDLATGKPVTLDQLFPGPEALAAALSWLSSTPVESRGHGMGPVSGEEPMRVEVTAEDMEIDRFVLLPEGLRIIFNPYEKASFSMGTITITIPRSEFARIGIPDDFWR